MKMQEVIGQLRTDVPVLVKHAQDTDAAFKKAWGLYDDLRRCESESGRALLQDAVAESMSAFSQSYAYMRACIELLENLNSSYTRKLGPKKPKAEDPRQMQLDLGEVK